MNNAKALEAQEYLDFLYIEEATSEEGESRRIKFSTSLTVETLKRVIAAELKLEHEWSTFDLVSSGKELTELNKSLASYGILDGDTIFYARDTPASVQPPPYTPSALPGGPKVLNNVMFQDLDGKTLMLHGIPESWSVKQLRDKLGAEKHISDQVGSYRFIWNGKQLLDGFLAAMTEYTMIVGLGAFILVWVSKGYGGRWIGGAALERYKRITHPMYGLKRPLNYLVFL
ncbi:uncharacterized protein BDR25DRAFT_338801 [Lindgomyces ingoldianus]|uniref:Uncharacterized protein n=1 Tax=Lindgomyces ingoldianus TaxID=673940 RepID=A0ACB6RG18_9PLEO|nr:uncharacterized protein BDR25DRAFT_338801 [Lindgomyces ingoldianus]KAF2478156.1 hypothetical protein BDR25DRAFT_338801 [Lindgomyces ingoldianus]